MDALAKLEQELGDRVSGMTAGQLLQAGFTRGAALMRERAQQLAQKLTDHNDLINKIGELSDIPQ